jgi:hypothetical protein
MPALLCSILLGGCLTAERKEYRFVVRPDGSGTGQVTFFNIMSTEEDGRNVSARDYHDLVVGFLKGNRFEERNPALGNVRKRLFEKDGRLNGEITFDFLSYEDVGLFRYKGTGAWMFYPTGSTSLMSGEYENSNGEFGGEKMPVVFWPEGTGEFQVSVYLDDPSSKDQSLLPYYIRGGVE